MRIKFYFLIALLSVVGLFNGQSVGQIAGEISVSSTGGANYTIPIANLPGIKDVTPNISLSYSSQSGNGVAGWGWNIGGISSITRVASTKFHDGVIDGVNYNNSDRFAFDGQRLLLKSGTYGADGAEYQTEQYSNVKIVSHGSVANGPEYFMVYYPDGKTAKFGGGSGFLGSNTFEWKMNYIEDAQQNRIKFIYDSYNNYIYIKTIEYGNNASVNPDSSPNKIQFYYKDAARTDQAYIYGARNMYSHRKLDRIEVTGNAQLYRKYQLMYSVTSLNYEKLVSIYQYNGSGETIKPVTFEYDNTENGIANNSKTITAVSPAYDKSNWQYTSGYFDSDSSIDFMTYPNSKDQLYRFNSGQLINSNSNISGTMTSVEKFKDIFSTKLVLPNDKYYNLDAISTVISNNTGSVTNEEIIKINNYIPNAANSLDLSFTNSYKFPTAINDRCIVINGSNTYYSRIPKEYFTGDFDGDGISDIVAVVRPYSVEQTYYCGPAKTAPDNRPPPDCCSHDITVNTSQVFLLKLDSHNSAVQSPVILGYNSVVTGESRIYVADFDGDGISDLYIVNPGRIFVYGMNNGTFTQKASFSHNLIKKDFPCYLADFNGDGKTDLVFPIDNANTNWFFIVSSGESFESSVKDIGTNYFKPQLVNSCYPGPSPNSQICGYMLQVYYYNFADINGDGRADLFYHDILTPHNVPDYGPGQNGAYLAYGDNYSIRDKGGVKYNMGSNVNGIPTFSAYVDGWQNNYTYGGAINKGTPIFLTNSNITNQNLDYAFFGGDKIKYVSFKKDNRVDMTLRKIKSNDLVTDITYDTVLDAGNGSGTYTADSSEQYPYVNLNIAPSVKLVKKIERSFNGESKIQEYRYKGAVMNLEGLGFMGFKGVAKSAVFGGTITQPLWTVSLHDIQKRGVIKESYLNGSVNFDSPSTFISKTVNSYTTSLLPNKVFVNLPSQIQQTDVLMGTVVNQYYDTYDTYNNPKKMRTVANGGEKITLIDYEDNPTGIGNQYYIGRPIKSTETQTLGTDVFSTEALSTYSNGLVAQTKKKGNNTDYITEDFVYDVFGNNIQKTLSTTGIAPRVEKMQFDPTGRFPIKTTDVLGTASTFTYDPDFGMLLSSTNSLNQAASNVYDTWQRKIEEKDIYNNSTKYYNEWIISGDFINGIKLRVVDATGATKETLTDNWGRVRLERGLSLNDKWIEKRTDYDVLDRPYKVSDPYFSTTSPSRWTVTEYDGYGRMVKNIYPTGKIITTSYNGLSATVVDGQKTQTITKDEWGNKVKMVDNGGAIEYTYYANGGLKSSNYAGHIIKVEQDGWGRKTKTSDPSVGGDYTYAYDGLGQLLEEKNPKGKTAYVYDQYGRVIHKEVMGDNTDIIVNFSYTAQGLLDSETGNSNGVSNSFTYKYDSFYRVSEQEENNGVATFSKRFVYDNFGRIAREKTETVFGALSSIVDTENIYASCGMLVAINDGNGKIIWKLNSINEQGQVISAYFGNGTDISNTYDANYYLRAVRHRSNAGMILFNEYTFAANVGLLESRKNNVITGGWQEVFKYDNQLRLISWSDPSGTQSQKYDTYGRIVKNSQVGEYKYTEGNRYRKKGINLNAIGDSYYKVNQLQTVSYNAYRSPVSIAQDGDEMVKFSYNIRQSRATSEYDYNKTFSYYGKYKMYSDDKTVEIITNSFPGKPSDGFVNTRIITYIAGDPYSAPAVYIKDFNPQEQVLTESIHYLHRDYQATILAISDKEGKIEERRHFDPWGNLVYLEKDGVKVDVKKGARDLFIERGYTGHEHFFQVGLIHMNGRIYDPKLHTFLSVDNNIQDPFNTQNYNRYGYVLNNPLMYTDPSGEFFWIAALIYAAVNLTVDLIATKGNMNFGQIALSIHRGAESGLLGGATSIVGAIIGAVALQASKLIPSIPIIQEENFYLGISFNVSYGNGFGFGASIDTTYKMGDFNLSNSYGISYYGYHGGTGLSGWEYRKSIVFNYDDGKVGFSLGSNWWTGSGQMSELTQKTGLVGFHWGDFRFMYENDGGILVKQLGLGDRGDSYRTAALNLSIGDYSAGFSLMTGYRGLDNQAVEEESRIMNNKGKLVNPVMNERDGFGRKFKYSFVNETGTPYRLGALYVGYKGYRVGVNSEHVRHAIQNRAIHGLIKDKGFVNQSWNWQPYFQYKTPSMFTTW
ncbi:polymorphic toxin type 23 domain-containing protein [Chryseobacterium sp. MYb328]|uniref:polymorphic toxin type 23 domain-containing protein n=1 Tax=Chryseobacterium sp. MYb328 TaxID=2745231 RepID=UPI00309C9C93